MPASKAKNQSQPSPPTASIPGLSLDAANPTDSIQQRSNTWRGRDGIKAWTTNHNISESRIRKLAAIDKIASTAVDRAGRRAGIHLDGLSESDPRSDILADWLGSEIEVLPRVEVLPPDLTDTLMSRTAVSEAGIELVIPGPRRESTGPLSLLALSAWCGLVSGLLEVGVIVLRKRTIDPNHFYGMSRHFLWLVPLVNLVIFLIAGVVLSLVIMSGRRRGRWLAAAALGGVDVAPARLGGRSPDFRPRRVPPGPGGRRGSSRRWSGVPPAFDGSSG